MLYIYIYIYILYTYATYIYICINSSDPFSANVPFLKPLKTLESQWFSDIFRMWGFLMFSGEIEKENLGEN